MTDSNDEKQKSESSPKDQKNLNAENQPRLLFITQREKAIKSTCDFLKKRGWECAVVGNTKDAFDVISASPPDFVLISWMLPGTNVPKIEKVLGSAFNIKCIVYSEQLDGNIFAQMSRAGFENVILSPLSGPTVQTKIRHIQLAKAQEENKEKAKLRRSSLFDDFDNGQRISCKLTDLPKSGSWEQVRERGKRPALWKLSGRDMVLSFNGQEGFFFYEGPNCPLQNASGEWLHGAEPGELHFVPRPSHKDDEKRSRWENRDSGAGQDEQDEIIRFRNEQKSDSGSFRFKGPEFSQNGSLKAGGDEDLKVGPTYFRGASTQGGLGSVHDSRQNHGSSNAYTPISNSTDSNGFNFDQSEINKNHKPNSYGPASVANEKGESFVDPKSMQPLRAYSDSNSEEADPGSIRAGQLSGKQKESVLAQKSMKSLQEIANPGDGPATPVSETQHIGVIPVLCALAQGVLMIAMGKNKRIDKALIQKLKEHLFKDLRSLGYELENELDFEIRIDLIDFIEWCEASADFLARAQHIDDEVAMAFIPGEEVFQKVHESAVPNMAAVEIQSIEAETVLDFDVYIHLKLNNRYVKYIRRGESMARSQIERLVRFHANYLHILKDDVPKFHAYCAANFIKLKIQNSERSKAA